MASAARIAARSIDDSRIVSALMKAGIAPETTGWTIDALTIAAWTMRPDVVVANADIAASLAGERVAGERPNPTVTLGPGAAVTNNNGDVSPWTVATSIDFTIETAGKREIRTDQARAQTETLQWQLAETLWAIRTQVRKAVIVRAYAQEAAALAEQEVMLRLNYQDWVQTEIRFGAVAQPDLLAAQTNVAQAENQLRQARGATAIADDGLAAALAIPTGSVPLAHVAAPPLDMLLRPERADLGTLRDIGLVNRLSVRHALANYQVTEQNLRVLIAQQYPDINLGPGYAFDRGDHLLSLSIGFTVPLFHGQDNAIAQALALRGKSAAQFESVQSQTMGEIDTALTRYRAAYASAAEAQNALGIARATVESVHRRITMGAADRGEILTAQILLVQAQRFLLDAQKASWDAIAALEDSVQHPIWPASKLAADEPNPSELAQ
jgi:outer membrane protein TolC